MEINLMSLNQLYYLRTELKSEGLNVDKLTELIKDLENQHIFEDGPGGAAAAASIGVGGGGVGYSNATTSGMGAVVSPQPSMFAGVTTEPGYSAGGGKVGSGDISVPYNPGGRKKVFQKVPVDNRRGSNKRRKNKIIQGLKNIFSQKQDYTSNQSGVKKTRVLDFDQFSKEKLSKVTKVEQ